VEKEFKISIPAKLNENRFKVEGLRFQVYL
jgi:hypothetical protein